jgi:adenosylmethionine-8-amino-7-oxononanoate aminotransferase
MVGIELRDFPTHARMGHEVTRAARRRGAVIRPLGDVVVLMPPLAMSADELSHLVQITAASVAEATSRPVLLAALA